MLVKQPMEKRNLVNLVVAAFNRTHITIKIPHYTISFFVISGHHSQFEFLLHEKQSKSY